MLGKIRGGPDISSRGGKRETDERRYATDLTFSAPKSVSIVALAGGDDRLLEAHDRAVRVALEYAEKHMLHARIGKAGFDSEFTGSMTAAVYRHETSRTVNGVADPQLHSHALVMNMTQRKDGTWASARLDFGKNNAKFQVLDSIYKAELARSIKEAGYQIDQTKDGFEIAGITREQIEGFSSRKAQIDAALEEHGLTRDTATARQRDGANLATREDKSQLSDVDQRYEWRERAREAGLDLPGLQEKARDAAKPDHRITADDAVKSAIHHLSERDTLFTETALLDESLKAGLGEVDYAEIRKAIEDRAGGLVAAGEVDRGEGKTEPLFTTKAAIYREAEIMHRAKSGQGEAEAIIKIDEKDEGVVSDVSFTKREIENGKRANAGNRAGTGDKISGTEKIGTLSGHRLRHLSKCNLDANEIGENPELLPRDARAHRSGDRDLRWSNDRVSGIISDFEQNKGFRLGDGQKAAIALALTTKDRHIGIVGAAGAGKTTAMQVIVEQYRQAGYEVIGVAPSAAAAKELESAGCDDTRTLASSLLKKEKVEEGQKPPKRLYVMDESGMVSAKDMDLFLKKVDAEGARSILVGDPLQLAAVEAGTPYAQMLDSKSIDHVKIDEIQRQKDPQLRKIAQAFAGGDAARGVELAKPYMQQVRPQKEDWEAAKIKEAEQPKKEEKFVPATEKMMELARAKGYEGSESFNDVRKFLDEKAYFVGITENGDGKAPLAPKEVRQEALARSAAEAYLRLSPEERDKTLLLAGTNATRQAINEKVREGLKSEGRINGDEVKIVALDKMDITREAATKAEMYVPKRADAQIIVKLTHDIKDKAGAVEAEKGSQWVVKENRNGVLTLENFGSGEKCELVIDPAKVKVSAYETRDMQLSAGDQIMYRENDKNRGIINGQQARVIAVDKETGNVIAETKTGEQISINPSRAEVMDYSYARTVHSSQGATVERAIVVGESSSVATAEAAYVACSREKTGLQIITDDAERLSKSWSKFAERQSALDATRTQAPENYTELQSVRQEADREAGNVGDLATKRADARDMLDSTPDLSGAKKEATGEPEAQDAQDEHTPAQEIMPPELEIELSR
jgi:conjugative relaxase-like TrwC/TraI family protein